MKTFRYVCIYLALGLAITVAVAWMSSCLVDKYAIHRILITRGLMGELAWYELWSSTSTSLITTSPDVSFHAQQSIPIESHPPAKGIERYFGSAPARFSPGLFFDACHGWPMVALRWTVVVEGATLVATGIQLGPGPFIKHDRDFGTSIVNIPQASRVVLPIEPIWGGLIADIAFWSVGPWFAIAGAMRCRAIYRRRQGRCERCGYPIDVARPSSKSPCPECGGDIPAPPTST